MEKCWMIECWFMLPKSVHTIRV